MFVGRIAARYDTACSGRLPPPALSRQTRPVEARGRGFPGKPPGLTAFTRGGSEAAPSRLELRGPGPPQGGRIGAWGSPTTPEPGTRRCNGHRRPEGPTFHLVCDSNVQVPPRPAYATRMAVLRLLDAASAHPGLPVLCPSLRRHGPEVLPRRSISRLMSASTPGDMASPSRILRARALTVVASYTAYVTGEISNNSATPPP